jgi:tripartite ATP-independent transporter DctP family solute receptor
MMQYSFGIIMAVRTILIFIAAVLWSGIAQGKDLQSADLYGRDYPTVRAVAYLGHLIEERTAGRIRISALGESSHNTDTYMIEAMRNGTLDMARINFPALGNLVPAAIATALPFIFRSRAHMRHVLDGSVGQELLASLEGRDLVGLCFYEAGPRSYYGSKPIRKASDLVGLKVRVPQSNSWKSLLRVPGMTTIPIPFHQTAMGLKAGVTDLAEGDWPAFVTSQHFKVAKYYSETRHSRVPGAVIMSKRTWQALSPQDQVIIRDAARDSVLEFRRLWDEADAIARQVAEHAGVQTISDIDGQSFADAAAAVYREQALSPELQSIIKRIQMAQ